MARGDRKPTRWRADRERKKAERLKRRAEQKHQERKAAK